MTLKVLGNNIKEMRALSLDKKAKAGNWEESRPVFLVTLNDGSALVIKSELKGGGNSKEDAAFSAKFGAEVMSKVGPDVGIEELTKAEVTAIGAVADKAFKPGPLAHTYLHEIITWAGASSFWIKMPFVDGLRTAEGMIDKAKSQKLLEKLKANNYAALRQLGEIAAVDLFTGNNDRFNSDGQLVNKGNIMFEKQLDGTYKPVGLDVFDGNSIASNLKTDPPAQWGGLKLQNQQSQRLYAIALKNALNGMFSAALGAKASGNHVFADPAVDALAHGLAAGAEALKAHLKTIVNDAAKFTPGMKTRATLLKWDLTAPASAAGAAPARPGSAAPGGPAPARPSSAAPSAPPRPGTAAPSAPPRPSSAAPANKPTGK